MNDRYSKYFLEHILWLKDEYCHYYLQDYRFGRREILDVEHIVFFFKQDAEKWLVRCAKYDRDRTMRHLRSFLATLFSEQYMVHRMKDQQVIRQAARQISRFSLQLVIEPKYGYAVDVNAQTAEPRLPISVMPEPDLDSLLAGLKTELDALVAQKAASSDGGGPLDRVKAFSGFNADDLKTLGKIGRTPDKMAQAVKQADIPGRATPFKKEIEKIVYPLAQTYEQAQHYKSILTIVLGEPMVYALLYDFAGRYQKAAHPAEPAKTASSVAHIVAALILAVFTAAEPSRLVNMFKLLEKIAAGIKRTNPRNAQLGAVLPEKTEKEPLPPPQTTPQKSPVNWVDLQYLYADGSAVAGARYEVTDTSGAVLAAGSLSGDGTARAGIPLGVSHVKVRYHGDPEHRAVLKSSHPTKYAAPPGWFARMTDALESAWETTKEGADWTWGMLKGDFNEDPTIAQTITNAIITAIPIVDQVGDVRDISANVKLLVWDKRFKEFGVWLALFFTLLGLIPTVGSLLKGVLKLVWKSARLDKILALFNHFIKGNGVKWLKELKAGKLKTYVKEAAAKGHGLLYSAIAKLNIIEQLIPARFKTLQAKVDDLHNTLRKVKAMINDQFSRIGDELLEKLDNILAEQSDEFEQGASKSTLKKQQRAEAPEDKLSSKGTDSIDDSSKKAYDNHVDKDGPNTTPENLKGPRNKTSETTGAVTNLGRKAVGDNRKIFEDLPVDGGMSGAYDHTTKRFILRPSTNEHPLPEGWVAQYGGHKQVLDDLAEAIGENLTRTQGRVSGFYIVKEADGTARFGWNSGQINPGSHGTRGVPPELRSEIKDSVVAALGL